ncbi:patatin, partial [Rhizobium sp. CRIBSB]|nr:patatin [Rhizobium sp. CRIBSB]
MVLLSACGTLERPTGALRIAPDQIIRVEDPRIRADDPQKMAVLVEDFAARLGTRGRDQTVLALSGGGANGAYGAGVLVGWTEHGDRPVFDIVTGVSTGALAAPFAFLGPDWDEALRQAYVGGGADGLLSARTVTLFGSPSLFSPRILHRLVEDNVTPEMLRRIAVEHARGRRLLVATTNLDSQETVIWDMGVLATQGDEAALTLFKDVLVASASIPGVFPPVLIAGVTGDGQVAYEMHVDGGVNTPFLAVPEPMLLWTSPTPGRASVRLYVIINGQLGRQVGITPGRIDGILTRSYDTMSKTSLRTSLAVTAAFAGRNGIRLSMSAVPDNIAASSLRFDTDSMQALFEIGRARGEAGTAWA